MGQNYIFPKIPLYYNLPFNVLSKIWSPKIHRAQPVWVFFFFFKHAKGAKWQPIIKAVVK